MSSEIAISQPARLERPAPFSFAPTSLQEALQFAERLAGSELVPKNFRGKPNDILVAMQMGAEVGLAPMQSLKSIAVINGMPSLYGDGFLAVIMSQPSFEWIKEDDLVTIEQNKAATCVMKRRGMEPRTVTFTWGMAVTAGLVGKEGPWRTYPHRQMQMRARGFCGRDVFPDALRGIAIYEEVLDTPGTLDARDYEPSRPQASVTVPTSQRTATQPSTTINAQQTLPEPEHKPEGKDPEAFIMLPEAKAFADAWKASGFTIEQAKDQLKPYMPEGVAPNSMKIKNADYDTLMKWARNEPDFDDARESE